MTHTVRIHWNREFENEVYWNEVCAWALERFGLPGDRFHTHANVNYMEFVFVNKKDALMMCLRWNAELISEERLTVETVSKFL